MGDPKKFKKKYNTSRHPWVAQEIEENRVLRVNYGLVTRKEILKAQTFLKKYKDLSKKFTAIKNDQTAKESVQVHNKLIELGLLSPGSKLGDVLGLNVESILDRRLQSVVYRLGLARTVKQARQFITHRHVLVGDYEITSPGYLVSLEEESKILFKNKSPLSAETHPERLSKEKVVQEEEPVKEEVEENNDEE